MGVSTTIIKVSQSPFVSVSLAGSDPGFSSDYNIWPIRHYEENPFVESIRKGVLHYRLQSASHFNISIEVNQTKNPDYAGKTNPLRPSFRIEVLFHDFNSRKLYRICRPGCDKDNGARKNCTVLTNKNIRIGDSGAYVPLYDFLSNYFPCIQDVVSADTLYTWWSANGKKFNWKELPTELKERIIHFCMHRSHEPGNSIPKPSHSRKWWSRRRGLHELTGQLGKWSSLLRVSHQVRAIALRLCFVGGSDMAFDKGLCIVARSYFEFADTIRRLGSYYQLSGPNSVPSDDRTLALAKTYKRFPKIFPQLKQYATIRHGIRRVHLQMGFLNYFHFFKITIGGFDQYWRAYYVDYQVFEQLPNLTELIIKLPDPTGRLDNKAAQPGPPLFYDQDLSCPRILHRLIYEQAAELLAPYDNVEMYGFIDGFEALRFKTLLNHAIETNKFTERDLQELYAENGGGIELEEGVSPSIPAQATETEEKSLNTQQLSEIPHKFWPPKCRCTISCRQLILKNQCGNF
ncbi:hypothetical protein BKA66DRAFT_564617 [Pyrenochaeta sp. MPI-SDFR-AT-0127]|nr:hypothetical protein BKA66DRAFT_564617 [Pyrenochaeta sp. MPI-SDFR-AT-0127]